MLKYISGLNWLAAASLLVSIGRGQHGHWWRQLSLKVCNIKKFIRAVLHWKEVTSCDKWSKSYFCLMYMEVDAVLMLLIIILIPAVFLQKKSCRKCDTLLLSLLLSASMSSSVCAQKPDHLKKKEKVNITVVGCVIAKIWKPYRYPLYLAQ